MRLRVAGQVFRPAFRMKRRDCGVLEPAGARLIEERGAAPMRPPHAVTGLQQLPVKVEQLGPAGQYVIMNPCHSCASDTGRIIAAPYGR